MMSDINCIHNKNCGHEVCTLTCPDFETERDLKADLELCNRATPGPWFAMKGDADIEGLIVTNSAGEMVLAETWYDGPLTAITQENLDMFVQAREGWPYAIEKALTEQERADKAEDLVKNLNATLYAIKVDLDTLGCDCKDRFGRLFKSNFCGKCLIEHDLHCANQTLAKAKEVLGDE